MRISDWSSDVCSSDLAVWLQYPALLVIDQIGHEYLIENLVVDGRILDRNHIFDAAIEIARHPVGRRDEELHPLMRQERAGGKGPDAPVLQKAADDRLDPDRFRQARHARPPAADAAHDQVDRKSTRPNASHYSAD